MTLAVVRRLELAWYFRSRTRSSSYLTHVSDRDHFVYVEVPKAGCSLVKRALHSHVLGGDPARVAPSVHDRSSSPLLRPEQSSAALRALFAAPAPYFRFTVVRDPFTRILSTYLDKIVGRPAERRRRLPRLGVDPDRDLAFDEFLTLVSAQSLSRMDIHWAPQVHLMGLPRVRYHRIGHFETLREDLRGLRTTLHLDLPDELLERVSGHATGASERLGEYYDATSVPLVQQIYRADFAGLGYADRFDAARSRAEREPT